jgi:hypothetical protein
VDELCIWCVSFYSMLPSKFCSQKCHVVNIYAQLYHVSEMELL